MTQQFLKNAEGSEAFWTIESNEIDEAKFRPEGKAKPQSKRSEARRVRRLGGAAESKPFEGLRRNRLSTKLTLGVFDYEATRVIARKDLKPGGVGPEDEFGSFTEERDP